MDLKERKEKIKERLDKLEKKILGNSKYASRIKAIRGELLKDLTETELKRIETEVNELETKVNTSKPVQQKQPVAKNEVTVKPTNNGTVRKKKSRG